MGQARLRLGILSELMTSHNAITVLPTYITNLMQCNFHSKDYLLNMFIQKVQLMSLRCKSNEVQIFCLVVSYYNALDDRLKFPIRTNIGTGKRSRVTSSTSSSTTARQSRTAAWTEKPAAGWARWG